MIGNDLEIEIIELFRKDITRLLSINQISKELGKSYPYIYKKITSFISEGIFRQAKIGNSILCSINLQNPEAVVLLTINELKNKQEWLSRDKEAAILVEKIKKLSPEIPIQAAVYCRNKAIIITDNQFYNKALKKEMPQAKAMTKKEFQEMALADFSQIKAHTLLYHNEKYYEILGEIEQELRIKNSPIEMQ